MRENKLSTHLLIIIDALIEWAKCGESVWSAIPTVLWALGTAALAHRLLSHLFRRFLFRRVPVWELILQNLLFLWIVFYSLHFWIIFVKMIKVFVVFCYQNKDCLYTDESGLALLQQLAVWLCGTLPLAFFIHTRPKPQHTPLMIWIASSPWQRREMGPYGYYLNRPLSLVHFNSNETLSQQTLATRAAFSDSKIAKKFMKKKRHSKSV